MTALPAISRNGKLRLVSKTCADCGHTFETYRPQVSFRCPECQLEEDKRHRYTRRKKERQRTVKTVLVPTDDKCKPLMCKHYEQCRKLVNQFRDPMCFVSPGAD